MTVTHIDGGARRTVALLVVFKEPIEEELGEALIWVLEDTLREQNLKEPIEAEVEHFTMERAGELIARYGTLKPSFPEAAPFDQEGE